MKKLALTAAVAALVTLGLAGQAHADMNSVWNWMPKSEAAKADRNDDSAPKAAVATTGATQATISPAAGANVRTGAAVNDNVSLAYPDQEVTTNARVAVKQQVKKQDVKTFNE